MAWAAAVLVLAVAWPQPGVAAENIWAKWWDDLGRKYPLEIPIGFIATFPGMLIATPFWLAGMAIDAITGEDEDADEAEEDYDEDEDS